MSRFEVLQPKLLANRKHIPVILEGRHRPPQRAAQSHGALLLGDSNGRLEGIALDVLHQGEVERNEGQNTDLAGPGCDMV